MPAGCGQLTAAATYLHVVRMHANQSLDSETLARANVVGVVVLLDAALVDTDVGELTVTARLELERQGQELLAVASFRVGLNLLGLVSGLVQREVGHFGRIGKVVDHAVEHLLHALVLQGAADEDGRKCSLQYVSSDGGL